jgi:transposase
MSEEIFTMSHKELDRVTAMDALASGAMKQKTVARQLGLSVRQVKRLLKRFRQEGPPGLVSLRRGRPSNRCLPEETRNKAMALVREHYHDFGPTLAHEKLTEKHGFSFSVETLRQWMINDAIWQPKARKHPKAFHLRERRSRFGELIQIDGSPHDWFEGRAEPCTLIVFIDDATGTLLYLRFVPLETTQAYMEALSAYLQRYGRPVSLYSDRHGIFRVNIKEAGSGNTLTQFGRALDTLDIEAIHANTPQAKGRVERANQTLQDRLVKELRLEGIHDMETANDFLEPFRQGYNRRFAVIPASQEDAHRSVLHSETERDLIFSLHNIRTLSKNLTIQYQNTIYQIHAKDRTRRLRFAKITVCEAFDGTITLLYQGQSLEYSIYRKAERPHPLENEKTINQRVDKTLAAQAKHPNRKPAPDHPWRSSFSAPSHTQQEQKGTSLSGRKGDISTLR